MVKPLAGAWPAHTRAYAASLIERVTRSMTRHTIHAHAHGSRTRTITSAGLTFLLLTVSVLAGCSTLRFPQPTAESANPHLTVAISTPTVAALLLTPVPTRTSPPPLPASASSPTPTFGLPLPEPTCDATPMWGLGDVWSNEDVRTRLGCPAGEQTGVQGEEIYFQNGHVLWRSDVGLIYVLFKPLQPDGWGAFVDTFQPSDPDTAAPTPAADAQVDVQLAGRFGKLWRDHPWLQERLGELIDQDVDGVVTFVTSFGGAAQDFEGGTLFWNGDVCFVLRTDDMSWTMY